MYRQKIQDYHANLSPSYRRVADFVMNHYYEVAFMTAAQLAAAVEVDATTIVRFSQRLGYPGYPELLQDIRAQMKEEMYPVYEPASLASNDPASVFKALIDQESANLRQILVHNPPSHLQAIASGIDAAERIVFVAEGDLQAIVQLTSVLLRRSGLLAEVLPADPLQQAIVLAGLAVGDVVVGVNGEDEGVGVARALTLARLQGCRTYGIVGKLDGLVNRWADEVLYVPSKMDGSVTGIVAITGALMALAQAVASLVVDSESKPSQQEIHAAYRFLTGQSEPAE